MGLKILKELDLKLVKVIDTHIHADHISGLNELSKQTNCSKIMGEQSTSEVLDIRVKDNEKIKIENIELISIYTPGHTSCSYSFFMFSCSFAIFSYSFAMCSYSFAVDLVAVGFGSFGAPWRGFGGFLLSTHSSGLPLLVLLT